MASNRIRSFLTAQVPIAYASDIHLGEWGLMSMRILIVEDSVTMRKVMEMTFAGEDAELLVVENGELALERGAAFGPDVAFIDSSLPGIDGYEVTRALKADPGLSDTAVILMASQHRPLDAARASEVGADDHILKPFDTQEAIDKASVLAGQAEPAGFSDMPSIPVARPATTPPRPVAQRSSSAHATTSARESRDAAGAPIGDPDQRRAGFGCAGSRPIASFFVAAREDRLRPGRQHLIRPAR